MILIEENKVRIGGTEERISKWEVWFMTPWGLARTANEAIEACKKAEIDPEAAIVPVPVAVTNALYEAYVRG